MSFTIEAQRSTSQHRILVELDIGIPNTQWINHGAGQWAVDTNNVYSWVDATLLSGFTAQGFKPIGSVKADGVPLQEGASLLDLADSPSYWYYDGPNAKLWVTMPSFDQPGMHSVSIGQIYAYSRSSFRPIGGPVPVEGRLVNMPSVQASRDPLFYGRLVYNGTSIMLANGDGEFDTFGRDTDIYGNDCRIFVGFEDVDYSEYLKVYTGFMEGVTVDEEAMTVGVIDKRKQLTKPITYVAADINALDAIKAILLEAYSYTYDSTFYDTAAWEAATVLVGNVTLNYQEPAAVIDVIEYIASSVFGLFMVDADGLFSFRVVDTDDSVETLIQAADILGPHSVNYDPSEVVSSVRVGYARDWTASSDQYTYYTDDSREATVFGVYKTYNERTFETALIDEAAAIAFAETILDYVDTVRGTETITVPIENYAIELGDQVGVIIQRGAQSMLGERKAEVVNVEYALDVPVMRLGIRHGVVTEDILTTENDAIITTEAESLIMVE